MANVDVSSRQKQLPPIRTKARSNPSPLLERRRSRKKSDGNSPREEDEDYGSQQGRKRISPRDKKNDPDYEEFRQLSIGSPVPTLGPDGEVVNSRAHQKRGGTNFPCITIQKCEENAEPGYRRRRERSLSPSRPVSPSIPLAKHRIDMNENPALVEPPSPRGGSRISRNSSTSSLLSPTTPPVQRKHGNKQYVLYNKTDISNSRSEGNLHEALERLDNEDFDLGGGGGHGGSGAISAPTTPRDATLLPLTPRLTSRSQSPGRNLSPRDQPQGDIRPSPQTSPYNSRRKPLRLEPLDTGRRRDSNDSSGSDS